MKRRSILSAVGGVTFGAALPVLAQTAAKVWRIGVLSQRHVDFVDSDYVCGPFVQGLGQLGYVAGRNVVIEWRSGEGTRSSGTAAWGARSMLAALPRGSAPSRPACARSASAPGVGGACNWGAAGQSCGIVATPWAARVAAPTTRSALR